MRGHDSLGRPLNEDVHPIARQLQDFRIRRQKVSQMYSAVCLFLCSHIDAAVSNLRRLGEMAISELLVHGHEPLAVAKHVGSRYESIGLSEAFAKCGY